MKAILLLLLITVVCPLAYAARIDIPGYDHTNEGNEFYVGFFRNRFGRASEQEVIDPVVCILARERNARVDFSSSQGRFETVLVRVGDVACVDIPIGLVVFDSTEDTMVDSRFKGIHVQARNNRRIIVFGQNEEVASNDGFVALPIIPRPAGSSYEFIAASVNGDAGTVQEAKDSVALIVGTETDTQIILEPSVVIPHAFASPLTGGNFVPGAPVGTRTVTIQRFQTFYLQVRGGDISGTRIIANKPISFFSGHECANIPLTTPPCDMLIEQVPPIDTWGTEVVTIPLITRSADTIKVFASQASTTVSVTRTDISSGVVTSDPSFTLNRNQFRELVISDYTLIQSNNPIGVFQFSRSYQTDNVLISDPFMLWVPPCEQYRDVYTIAPLPFDPSIEGTIDLRVAYVNYTNIAVPAEYFNASMITINNNPINASEFSEIRRADNSIWGYGAQLTLDVGAQVIQHQDSDAALSVTMYGFSNQQSWGCAGGTGLAPLTIAVMECSDVTVVESVGNAVVQCTRSGATSSSVSFNVTTVDGTATAGNDYTSVVTREFTFGAGETSVSIPIPIIDDSVPESQEMFTLSIAPNPNIVPPADDPVVTVIDDDATIEFSAPRYTTMESSGVLQAALIASLPVSSDYQVRVRFFSGTASRSNDITGSAQRITIPAGETRVNFSVPVTIDGIFEGTETFDMTLQALSSAQSLGVEVGTQGTAIGEIIDAATVMFSQTMYSVDESAGTAQIGLVLSEPPSTATTVQVTNTDGSATGGGVDYDSGPYTVTFPAGSTTATFNVPITADNVFEGTENFMLTIDSSSLPTGLTVGDPGQATVTITEEDITVMFSQTTYNVDENAGPARPELVLSNPSSTDVTVEVFNTDGSATGGGVDYDSGPYTVTIPAGNTTATFNIPINDDDILEGPEDFMLTINSSSLPGSVRLGTPSEATVIIGDDDSTTVTFSQTTYSVNEGAGSVQIGLVLSDPSSTDTFVEVFNTDGSATGGGVDYTSGPYTVTIPAGQTTATFNIPINDDDILEGPEDFMLTINSSSLTTGVTRGNPGQATVTIVDDDPITVTFNQTTYSVNENAGPARPGLVLSNPSSTDITVEVFNTNRTAFGGGVDYDSGPYTVTFPAGQTTSSFSVPINDDDILEGNENFMLTIDETLLPTGVTRGNPGEATVTIVDDDELEVTFSQTTYSGLEDSGVVSVTLLLEGGTSSSDISVTVTPSDQSPVSAQGNGVDYTSTPITATFLAGTTSVTIDVPVNVDNIAEQRETFDLSFTIPSSLSGQVSPGRITDAVGAILDDTPTTVMFTETTYSVDEDGGSVVIGVELSNPSATDTVVVVYHTDGSATGGGVDYTSGPYTVTIPAGQTTATFNVPINDDMILEGNENFMLTINETALPDDVTRGNPGEATVTIVDNDPITVMFTETTYTVDEDGGSVTIGVELSNPSATNTVVEVFNTDGSATGGGVDYTSGPYTVTIPAGDTTATFNVPVNDDMIREGNENFMLTIDDTSLPTGVTRGNPGEATVTIVDDDAITIMFSERTYNVDEDAGPAQPVLVLSNPSSTAFTVRVREQSGTATRNDDYGPGPYTVTIPAGVTTVPFDIPIVDDNILENNEDFNIIIVPGSLPDDVTRGDPGAATVTIVNDDAVTVRFQDATDTVSEDDGSVTITIIKEGNADIPVMVRVTTSDGSATAGSDYGTAGDPSPPVITPISIPAGQSSVDITVSIIDDNCREEDETFNADLTVLPNQAVNLGSPDRTMITIEDDDESIVQFFNAPYTVAEIGGSYNVCLSITPACDRRAEVDLVTEPKDALPNQDYFLVRRTVSFAPNQMIACTLMDNIISDNVRETDECFSLAIDPPNGSGLVPGGNANVTIIDNTIITSPGIFNDTVIGDPLYEVPLNRITNETFPVTTSLCYEIHGEADKIFNLISDGCVQVNANYSAMDIPENGNIISQIGVFAYDTAGGCIQILVDVDDCVPVVNGVAYSSDPGYSINGVTARRRNGRARISVPNCANELFDNLVFWVTCQNISNQKMIKFQVVRGNQLIPDSHGLMGQFWNIPVSADIFTGNLTTDSPVTPYVVTVDHPDDPPRQFVAELFERTWDKSRRPCLYAGDGQGGSIFDPVTPNDPVIAGTFRDYEVSSLFGSDFVYNKLEERDCP